MIGQRLQVERVRRGRRRQTSIEGWSRRSGSDVEFMAEMLSPDAEEQLVEETRSASGQIGPSPSDLFYDETLSFDVKLEQLQKMLPDPAFADEAQGYIDSLARMKVLREESGEST